MYPPCEVTARYVLPIFRSLVAKELIQKYNFKQIEAAEKLGTTQAAISQYIRSKRGYRASGELEEVLPLIQAVANEVAEGLATGKIKTDEVALSFCKLCASLRKEKNP